MRRHLTNRENILNPSLKLKYSPRQSAWGTAQDLARAKKEPIFIDYSVKPNQKVNISGLKIRVLDIQEECIFLALRKKQKLNVEIQASGFLDKRVQVNQDRLFVIRRGGQALLRENITDCIHQWELTYTNKVISLTKIKSKKGVT